MSARRSRIAKTQPGLAKVRNTSISSRTSQRERPKSRRANVGNQSSREPFSPPEDWHEPKEDGRPYRIIKQAPGPGYRHVVTPADIRDRLSDLPPEFLKGLEVVQLSRMTRKKQSFPCYGMQWGSSLYLYPLEESLTEHFATAPQPTFFNEARMYGGKWEQDGQSWTLTWSESAIRDFYLNNILIHELGHLLDDRNSSYTDRERYAEWFAIQYGYRATGGATSRRGRQARRRRHHSY
jgi:hypothetical protein